MQAIGLKDAYKMIGRTLTVLTKLGSVTCTSNVTVLDIRQSFGRVDYCITSGQGKGWVSADSLIIVKLLDVVA